MKRREIAKGERRLFACYENYEETWNIDASSCF